MNTITIAIGRNKGYNPSMMLDDHRWGQFRAELWQSIRQNGFEVLAETNGTSVYRVGQNFMKEETRQYVLELPTDKEVGPFLVSLQMLAQAYDQREIAVTYGVYKPVSDS